MPVWQMRFARSKQPPLWTAAVLAALLVGAMAWVRLALPAQAYLPIGFGVPIVLIGLLRYRTLLWAGVAAFAGVTLLRCFRSDMPWSQVAMVLVDLLVLGGVVDLWVVSRFWFERRNTQLAEANNELAAREEEIARQNEELQSQTEELERQSEELRVANEELAHREQILEILLSLSRSLSTELEPDQIMNRICQTLGLLINGPTAAAGIIEIQGDRAVVRCHHGFGPAGIREKSFSANHSLAALVMTRGRTGYIEDLSLRPDLSVPQPVEGDPMAAVLACPVKTGGQHVGSLEVYSRHRTTWSQEQVALIESLAAQASISLEAADLFRAVSRERGRLEAVLRTTPVGVAICNADCSEARLNPAGAAMLNIPVDQNILDADGRQSWQIFQNGKWLPFSECPLMCAAREGIEAHGEEIEIVLASGRRLICLTYARPIRGEDGTAGGAVAIYVDITAHKELQRELDLRRREAEEASIRKTRFLAAVSHDIRTPANAISLLAELIRRTASNPAMVHEIPELAQELHGSSVSLVNLLSDVLDIARFDSDKVELQESEFLLSGMLRDEQRQLLPLARQKEISLEFIEPNEQIVVRTDRIKLSRILGNLVGNAIKFTEIGGVRVETHRNEDGSVCISVFDTGIGIPEESLGHIFDEFFQLRNPERDRAKGSGLGLTICKRLVDAMGGRIDVRSTPGQGSTFTVTLPVFATVPHVSTKPAT